MLSRDYHLYLRDNVIDTSFPRASVGIKTILGLCVYLYFFTSKRRSWNFFHTSHSVLFQILLFCQMSFLDLGFSMIFKRSKFQYTNDSNDKSDPIAVLESFRAMPHLSRRSGSSRTCCCLRCVHSPRGLSCRLPAHLVPYVEIIMHFA